MKHYLLSITLLLYCLDISVYASGQNENISIISGRKEYYHNRALEKELLSQGYKNNARIIFNYTDTKNNNEDVSFNIIKKNIENSIATNVFSLRSNEQLQTINNTIIKQGILEHSLIDYTLVTAQFFSSLIFIETLPSETLKSFVPWGFIGYDISTIVNLQLSYLQKTNTDDTVLVFILDKDSNFETMWLETLKNKISANKKIFVEYLEDESHETIIQLLKNKTYKSKNNIGILTLYDYIAIRVGISLLTMNYQNNYRIVGFGGSPEAQFAITNNIIHMSIMPDYKEYGTKIITLAKKLQERKRELIKNDYTIDTAQTATEKVFISVSAIQ